MLRNRLFYRFCEKSEQALNQFPKHCQKTVLGNFSAKLRKGMYFQAEVLGKGVVSTDSNDIGVRVVLLKALNQ